MDEINIDAYVARIRARLMSCCVIKIIDPATQQEEEIRPPSRRTSVSMSLVPPPSERDQYEIEIRRLEEALNRKRAEYNNRFPDSTTATRVAIITTTDIHTPFFLRLCLSWSLPPPLRSSRFRRGCTTRDHLEYNRAV